jgi:hypothetical protein
MTPVTGWFDETDFSTQRCRDAEKPRGLSFEASRRLPLRLCAFLRQKTFSLNVPAC